MKYGLGIVNCVQNTDQGCNLDLPLVIYYINKRPRGLYADDFFKFSGISLVSVGRVRPGNEIKSKW